MIIGVIRTPISPTTPRRVADWQHLVTTWEVWGTKPSDFSPVWSFAAALAAPVWVVSPNPPFPSLLRAAKRAGVVGWVWTTPKRWSAAAESVGLAGRVRLDPATFPPGEFVALIRDFAARGTPVQPDYSQPVPRNVTELWRHTDSSTRLFGNVANHTPLGCPRVRLLVFDPDGVRPCPWRSDVAVGEVPKQDLTVLLRSARECPHGCYHHLPHVVDQAETPRPSQTFPNLGDVVPRAILPDWLWTVLEEHLPPPKSSRPNDPTNRHVLQTFLLCLLVGRNLHVADGARNKFGLAHFSGRHHMRLTVKEWYHSGVWNTVERLLRALWREAPNVDWTLPTKWYTTNPRWVGKKRGDSA